MQPPPATPSPPCFEFLKYNAHSQAVPDHPYIDSETSPTTPNTDADLQVRKDGFWCYCGPVLTKTADDGSSSSIPASLDEWCSSTLTRPLSGTLWPFLAYAATVLEQYGLEYYWVSVRATRANAEFDVPRWHTDDLFFGQENKTQGTLSCRVQQRHRGRQGAESFLTKMRSALSSSRNSEAVASPIPAVDGTRETDFKLCTTLRGPSTRFIPDEHQALARSLQASARQQLATDHTCVDIRCVGCASTAEAVRARLAVDMAALGTVSSLVPDRPGGPRRDGGGGGGECCFFRLGPDRGAVHSEPPQSEDDRVFVNVVPGTKTELGGLMAKWGMEFPRSWGVVRDGVC